MISPVIALAAAFLMSPDGSSAFPPTGDDTSVAGPAFSIATLTHDYEAKSKALQSEMGTLKQSDGGHLTAEHQAYLQQKLIRLLDEYHNALQRSDPMAVNADGSLPR